eukprot:1136959-Pelagomonas_calceolata.AAC.2
MQGPRGDRACQGLSGLNHPLITPMHTPDASQTVPSPSPSSTVYNCYNCPRCKGIVREARLGADATPLLPPLPTGMQSNFSNTAQNDLVKMAKCPNLVPQTIQKMPGFPPTISYEHKEK